MTRAELAKCRPICQLKELFKVNDSDHLSPVWNKCNCEKTWCINFLRRIVCIKEVQIQQRLLASMNNKKIKANDDKEMKEA